MSAPTDIILIFSQDEDSILREKDLKKFTYGTGIPLNLVSVCDDRLPEGWFGGVDLLKANIYMGAFNHFNLDNFLLYLMDMQWECPECVQVFAKEANDVRFKVFDLFENDAVGHTREPHHKEGF